MFSISYKQRARVVSPRALFRYFQMNSLANLTVFTLKKGYARNVCDFSQFDTFAYFYAISTFYFLLNISVTHRPRITNTFVFVPPLHFS